MTLATKCSSKIAAKDPRKGLPSASKIEQLNACPGSWKAQQPMPEPPENPDAAVGRRIHKALETGDTLDNPAEQETAEMCRNLTDELIGDTLPGETRRICEQRWFCSENDEVVFSGQADLVVLQEPRALIIDYKTGRNAPPTSARNLQLRALAVLLKQRLPHLREIYTAVVQPWCRPQTNGCLYRDEDLDDAREQVLEICQRAKESNPPRLPGMHCEWCKAKAVCPEAIDASLAVTKPLGASATKALDLVAAMTGDKLAAIMPQVEFAERVFKALRSEIRSRLEADPNAVPGYKLKEVSPRRSITDLPVLASRLEVYGVPLEQFTPACTITRKNVEKLLRDAGLKGKSLTEELETVLDGLTTDTPMDPRLVKT